MKWLVLTAALMLAACGNEGLVIEKPVITYVEKRVECPSPAERARLKAERPVALRNQPMPDNAAERVAKSDAQLGKYEAEGAWADQVDTALDRCQAR